MDKKLEFGDFITSKQFEVIVSQDDGFANFEEVVIHRFNDELEDMFIMYMKKQGVVLTDRQVETIQKVREEVGLFNYSDGVSYARKDSSPEWQHAVEIMREVMDLSTPPVSVETVNKFLEIYRTAFPMFQKMCEKMSDFYEQNSTHYDALYDKLGRDFNEGVELLQQQLELQVEVIREHMRENVRTELADITERTLEGREGVTSIFSKR